MALGAVPLVSDDVSRADPWPSWSRACDPDAGRDLTEAGAVVDVAACEHEREGPPETVTGEVDLRGQSTPGSTKGVILWFVRFPAPPLAPAAC